MTVKSNSKNLILIIIVFVILFVISYLFKNSIKKLLKLEKFSAQYLEVSSGVYVLKTKTNSQTTKTIDHTLSKQNNTNNFGLTHYFYYSKNFNELIPILKNGNIKKIVGCQIFDLGKEIGNIHVHSGAQAKHSAGISPDWSAYFKINNQTKFSSYGEGRGLNFYVIKPDGTTSSKIYDTHGGYLDNNIINYINSMPDFSIFMMAVNDEADYKLNESMSIFKKIGTKDFYKLGYRSAYAFIGLKYKGSGLNFAESLKLSRGGQAGNIADVYYYMNKYLFISGNTTIPPTVNLIPVQTVNYHSLEDGFYKYQDNVIDYFKAIDGKLEEYEIFHLNKTSKMMSKVGNAKIIPLNINNQYFIKIFETGEEKKTITNKINNITTFKDSNYFIHNDKQYINSPFNLNNNITLTNINSINNIPTDLLDKSHHHLIFNIIKNSSNLKYNIICVTNNSILKLENNNVSFVENSDQIDANDDKYNFYILNINSKYLIFQHTSSKEGNGNVKNTYKYLKINGDKLIVETLEHGLQIDNITNNYYFSFVEITNPNLECLLTNNYKQVNNNYIHKNHSENNYNEIDCKNIDKYNNYTNCLDGTYGCNIYLPSYIENNDKGYQKFITNNYDFYRNKKIDDTKLNTHNDKTIKECQELCDSDNNCAGFEFNKILLDKVIIDAECKLIDYGNIMKKSVDGDYDIYQKKVVTDIKELAQIIPETTKWSTNKKTLSEAQCGQYNENTCNNNNNCFFREACYPKCEIENNECISNVSKTIGSINDFNFDLNGELNENNKLLIKITNIDNIQDKKITYPVIKSDGLHIEFECFLDSKNYSTSNDGELNSNIVNYEINYNEDNINIILNNNDTFELEIPEICNNDNQDMKLSDRFNIFAIFTDIYNISKKIKVNIIEKQDINLITVGTIGNINSQVVNKIHKNLGSTEDTIEKSNM